VERPFIGRSGELERIVDLIASPRVTTAAVVLGDPGVGKSRLLEEVTSATGGRLLPVIGYESERLVPLAASADLLRALASVPVFGDALDEILFRGPSGAEPVRVFELAHRALAASGPALIVVDDLQWLDDLSLALVHYLLRGAAAADTAVRLLAAGRPVAGSMGFAEEVAQLLGPRSLVVELAPLGVADAVELGLSLDPKMGRDQALTLAERSQGFPFWIETLVRSGEHAPDVDRLVTGRLRTATPDAAPLLAILAVASRPLASEDAAELMGWPMARTERTVEELVARGLGSHAVGGIQPSHDLVREAVLVQLSEEERRRLHLRLATWLEGAAGQRISLLREALDHRVAAGEQSVELASRLVSSPRRRLLGVAGLASIAAVANETLPTDEAGQVLHAGLASLAYELGEYALALQCWAVLGEELEDPRARGTALLWAARAARQLGEEAEARAFAVRARACARDAAALLLQLDVLEASWLLAARTEDPRGRELAADVAARSRAFATSDREAYLDALQLEFQISLYDADAERALVLADEIADAARSFDEVTRVRALVRGGGAARLFGAFSAAEVRLRSAWTEARTLMLPPLIVQAAYELAQCLFRLARLDEAEAVVEEAQELALRLGDPTRERFGTQRVAALIALERGNWRDGLESVDRAIADEPDRHLHIDLRAAAATALARVAPAREHDRILVHLTHAQADAEAVGCRRCSGELLLVRAELLARIDSLDEAHAALAEADRRRVAEDLGRTGSFWRSRAEALISLHAGDAADAAAQLERVVEEAQRLERNLDVLWLQLDLAQALAAVDRVRALELLEAVASNADAYGARTASGVADALRRRLGVRTWRRSRAGGGTALSEREREIAALVAGGASNPEIAQALYLSRKTVERHVSNILAKVGARNRVELATLLSREGEGAHR